jgi:hypothetical protein
LARGPSTPLASVEVASVASPAATSPFVASPRAPSTPAAAPSADPSNEDAPDASLEPPVEDDDPQAAARKSVAQENRETVAQRAARLRDVIAEDGTGDRLRIEADRGAASRFRVTAM